MNFTYRLILFFILIQLYLFPQIFQKKVFHPFTGTVVLSIEGGSTYGITDYKNFAIDYIGRGSIEYYFPFYSKSSFGVKAIGGIGYLKNKDYNKIPSEVRTDLKFFGGGIVYNLSIAEVVFPYFFAGVSFLSFTPKGDNGNLMPNYSAGVYKKNEINYNAEFGFRFLLTDQLTLNLGGVANISPNDYLDDSKIGTSNDIFFSGLVGFSFSFFGESDSDGDGIVDSKDLCPNSPLGVYVDSYGCPIDNDKDGVPDFLDRCNDTPAMVKVDRFGCPLDTDKDGVPDYLDICPNTPKNVAVDEFGCALDRDNDGVPDYLDKCPGTTVGIAVDKDGCPIDTDKDGVPDYLDKCPNTPTDIPVDEKGCPSLQEKKEIIKEVPVVKEVVLSAGASFQSGKSTLLSIAFEELDKLVLVMKNEPTSRWLVEGHTDNVGSIEKNIKLSFQRANAVVNYFISQGISKSRFEIRGMGPSYPIADNKIEEGRAKNRRVKILRLD